MDAAEPKVVPVRPLMPGIVAAVLVCAAVLVFVPRVPQPPGYHTLADMRTFLGIPNFMDVVSNASFAIVGLWGLRLVFGSRWAPPSDRRSYGVMFAGTLLTAAGSACYHLAPDNATLVWDRLPMTIAFTGLVTAIAAERVGREAGRALVPLVVAGIASVAWWWWTERRGAGDLRPYGLVQFGSLAAVVLMIVVYDGPFGDGRYLWAGLGMYAAAKALEFADRAVFDATRVVSGHTLKHIAAACGAACVAAMLHARVSPARGSS